jgi:hypothetical protein
MTNRFKPHLLVLPEDDANRQIATGFVLDLDQSVLTKIQVLEEVGGWIAVLDTFESDHVAEMDRFTNRHMVLLIDFDGEVSRMDAVKHRIPERLSDRVFVLGARTEPEALKAAGLGSFETIGRAMAKDCREETETIWAHDLLRQNVREVNRLREGVRQFLFRPRVI